MDISNFNMYCQNIHQEGMPTYTQTQKYLWKEVSLSPGTRVYLYFLKSDLMGAKLNVIVHTSFICDSVMCLLTSVSKVKFKKKLNWGIHCFFFFDELHLC